MELQLDRDSIRMMSYYVIFTLNFARVQNTKDGLLRIGHLIMKATILAIRCHRATQEQISLTNLYKSLKTSKRAEALRL